MAIFKQGDRVKIINNLTGHNIPIGTPLVVKGYNSAGYVIVAENRINFNELDLELMTLTKNVIKQKMEEYEHGFLNMKQRLDYLEENKIEEIDEEKFREYEINKIISSKLSNKDKVKEIKILYGK